MPWVMIGEDVDWLEALPVLLEKALIIWSAIILAASELALDPVDGSDSSISSSSDMASNE